MGVSILLGGVRLCVGLGWVVRWPGALCASGGWHIAGLMVVWDAMCERWLAHLRVPEVPAAVGVPWIGCFCAVVVLWECRCVRYVPVVVGT